MLSNAQFIGFLCNLGSLTVALAVVSAWVHTAGVMGSDRGRSASWLPLL